MFKVYSIDITSQKGELEKICKRMRISKAEAIRDSIDFADDLRIDIVLVDEILKGLAEKGVVE